MFFRQDTKECLCQLQTNALDEEIFTADGATLKLDNKKNGWKGVCFCQEQNLDAKFIPVRSLGRRYVSIRQNMSNKRHIFQRIGLGENAKILLWRTQAHRCNFQPTH